MTESLAGLGRLFIPDAGDLNYMLPRRLTARTQRYWYAPPALDQRDTSECVAYSTCIWLESSPVINRWAKTGYQTLTAYYWDCQREDAWPGGDYPGATPRYDGSSVRASMKVLKRLGLISEYRWAHTLQPAIDHILLEGPMLFGTNWYRDMFMPDRHGYIWPEGPNEGGHAWMVRGINTRRENPDGTIGAARGRTSWGRNWGQHGEFWISLKCLERLIEEDGEAATATEVKK